MDQDKKNMIYAAMVVCVFSILVVGFIYCVETANEKFCKENNIPKEYCGSNKRSCYIDCRDLELEYFRYNSGGFGSESCFCIDENNRPLQIW